jgi:hypothetical protein
LLLFHPAAFAAGESAAVTVGPVLSRMYEVLADPLDPVHLFWLLKPLVATMLIAWTPSPAGAVPEKDQLDFAVDDC